MDTEQEHGMNTKLVAHRGYAAKHPENTLAAFRTARELGADAIELDVHMSRDGQLVVHHDYYLGNPDDGEGLVFERDLAYIETLRISGRERIPTLAAVFAAMGDSVQYELELKGFTDEFLQKVVVLAKHYELAAKIEFTSPVPYVLTRLKEIEPNFKTGIFLAPFPNWMDTALGRVLAVNSALLAHADVLHCPLAIIDEELLILAHEHNLMVHAADCNSEEELTQALRVGVDQLSTDRLELALLVRERM